MLARRTFLCLASSPEATARVLVQTAPPTPSPATGNQATPRPVEWRLTTNATAVGPGIPEIDTMGNPNDIKMLKVTVTVLGKDKRPLDKCEVKFSISSSNQSTDWLPLDNPPKIGMTELSIGATLDVVQVQLRRPSKTFTESDPFLIYYNAINRPHFTQDVQILFQVK